MRHWLFWPIYDTGDMYSIDVLRGCPGVISFQLAGQCFVHDSGVLNVLIWYFSGVQRQGKALQTTCVYIK